jgi:hypothetical protein
MSSTGFGGLSIDASRSLQSPPCPRLRCCACEVVRKGWRKSKNEMRGRSPEEEEGRLNNKTRGRQREVWTKSLRNYLNDDQCLLNQSQLQKVIAKLFKRGPILVSLLNQSQILETFKLLTAFHNKRKKIRFPIYLDKNAKDVIFRTHSHIIPVAALEDETLFPRCPPPSC